MNDLKHDSLDLTNKTIHSLIWLVSASGFQSVLRLLIVPILARLLEPSDFGILAAATIITGFAEIFSQIGIGPSLVQRAEINRQHVSSALTISIVLGFITASLTSITAPLVSNFFTIPDLVLVLRILSITFLLSGLTVVSESLLSRSLQFKKIATVEALSFSFGYGLFAIILAYKGMGVWALVGGIMAQSLIRTVGFLGLRVHKWSLSINREASKELLQLGSGFTLLQLLNYFALQGDYIVVGRTLGTEALGFYNRAYQLMALPVSVIGKAMNKVLFASMSNIQSDTDRLRRIFLRQISIITTLLLPISAFCFVLAPEIIALFLGSGWEETIVPFQILTLGIFLRIGYRLSSSLTQSVGAVYANALRQGIYGGTILLGAWVGHYWGIIGVSYGVLAALLLHYFSSSQLALSKLNISWVVFAKSHLSGLYFASTVLCLGYIVANYLRSTNAIDIVTLLFSIIVIFSVLAILVLRFPAQLLGNDSQWLLEKISSEFKRGLKYCKHWN